MENEGHAFGILFRKRVPGKKIGQKIYGFQVGFFIQTEDRVARSCSVAAVPSRSELLHSVSAGESGSGSCYRLFHSFDQS
jgi:hypothetical protein